jgi:septum formation protein
LFFTRKTIEEKVSNSLRACITWYSVVDDSKYMLTKPNLYLASQSPRRKELLGAVLKRFIVRPPRQQEPSAPKTVTNLKQASHLVMDIAEAKAAIAWQELPAGRKQNSFLISADTLVFAGKRVLGKPTNAKQAKQMLRLLSGKKHTVLTAVCVAGPQRSQTFVNRTDVTFYKLSKEFIDWYVASGEPMDKAGAYGAQAAGAAMIKAFDGSYTNVVGLPLAETLEVLEKVSKLPWRTWC